MKGAYSTLKEEGRPAVTNTTKLSDRGAFSIAGMMPRAQCSVTASARVQQRSDRGARDLRIQYGGGALALFGFLARDLSVDHIIVLGYFVGQPFVHELIAPKPELFIPGPVFELVSQNLFEAEGREIIAPK